MAKVGLRVRLQRQTEIRVLWPRFEPLRLGIHSSRVFSDEAQRIQILVHAIDVQPLLDGVTQDLSGILITLKRQEIFGDPYIGLTAKRRKYQQHLARLI